MPGGPTQTLERVGPHEPTSEDPDDRWPDVEVAGDVFVPHVPVVGGDPRDAAATTAPGDRGHGRIDARIARRTAPGPTPAPRALPPVRRAPRPADRARRLWAALDAPATDRRVPGTLTVAAIALVIGLAASAYTAWDGSNLLYVDSQAHLTIARRILDSKEPGFQQLGTVWLPMPHLLLLPFVQSLWLWHTGLAAGILGALCLSATAAGIHRTCARIGLGRTGRVTAVLVLLTSVSVLYVYTTALTEPVLLAAIACTVAGLARWATSTRRVSGGELAVFAGVPAAVAVLSRYEGWALVLGGGAFVALVAYRRRRSWSHAARMTWSFAAVPGLAVVWWLSYNLAIYGDPLEFMLGPYSAKVQQQYITDFGLAPTKGNLGLSLYSLNWSFFAIAGLVPLVVAAVGAVVLVTRRGLSERALVVWLSAVAYAFAVVSLFLGQTIINNGHTLPANLWNNRFALSGMIPVALLAGVAADAGAGLRRVGAFALPLAVVALGLQCWWTARDPSARSSVVAEARYPQTLHSSDFQVGRWLHAHYRGGGILIDESAIAILPTAGIPIDQYYNRSTGPLFDRARRSPARYARYVVVNLQGVRAMPDGSLRPPAVEQTAVGDGTAGASASSRPVGAGDSATQSGPVNPGRSDRVAAAIAREPGFAAQYRVVFATNKHRIYERIAP